MRGNSTAYTAFGKRLLDLALGVAGAPVILPVIGILCLLVRRDGGPAFYMQQRVGRNGRQFACLKLRTMVVDADKVLADLCAENPKIAAEWHRHQKLHDDPRITRIGRFLRRSSLDELPQVLNVLAGQMSLVGPRPFTPEQQDLYREAGGQAYFRMRPGITGPWQIHGRSETRFVDRVHFDELYGETISLRSDLRLVIETVGVVLKMTGK
ncbi:MAG: sugar transferase [Limimaricola sp.]|nr:sugar transferase [Limimaricola sp.]